VFNLNKPEHLNGSYHNAQGDMSDGGGTRATIKNQNGVVVNLLSTVEGRKFNLASEGMEIQLKNE